MLPNSNFDLNNNGYNQNSNNDINQNNNFNNNINYNNMPQNNNYNPQQAFETTHQNTTNNPQKEDGEFQYVYETKPEKSQEEINAETGQARALIAYLGPFVLIPYFQEKENPFVLYHVKQGMNLFIIEVIIVFILEIIKFALLTKIFWIVSIIDFGCGMFVIGLSLIGIYYVLEGKMQEIPIVGSIKFVK